MLVLLFESLIRPPCSTKISNTSSFFSMNAISKQVLLSYLYNYNTPGNIAFSIPYSQDSLSHQPAKETRSLQDSPLQYNKTKA